MRVVSWNLGFAYRRDEQAQEKAWRYLLDEIDPDIAMLQQAVPPAWARDVRTVVLGEPPGRWGSAIVTKGLAAEPVGAEGLRRLGADVVCARIGLPGGELALVASVYTKAAPLSAEDRAGVDIEGIRRSAQEEAWYNDLAYAILKELAADGRFIVGGDWQTGRLLDRWERHRGAGEEFFARAERDGWAECLRRFHPEEQRTLFRGDRGYQFDHMFCDRELGARLRSCDVVPEPAAQLGLSDRAAIVMELDLPPV